MTTEAVGSPREELSFIDRLFERLRGEARLHAYVVVRPHPLVLSVRGETSDVVVVPAAVWDGARHLLKPFAGRLADGASALLLVGRPRDPDLGGAVSRGLAS